MKHKELFVFPIGTIFMFVAWIWGLRDWCYFSMGILVGSLFIIFMEDKE